MIQCLGCTYRNTQCACYFQRYHKQETQKIGQREALSRIDIIIIQLFKVRLLGQQTFVTTIIKAFKTMYRSNMTSITYIHSYNALTRLLLKSHINLSHNHFNNAIKQVLRIQRQQMIHSGRMLLLCVSTCFIALQIFEIDSFWGFNYQVPAALFYLSDSQKELCTVHFMLHIRYAYYTVSLLSSNLSISYQSAALCIILANAISLFLQKPEI